MKSKLFKKICMSLCAVIIAFGTIGMSTTEADAWGWKKTKVNKNRNVTYSKKYYSDADMTKMAKTIDKAVADNSKRAKKIGVEAIKGLFKGGISSFKKIMKELKLGFLEKSRALNQINKEFEKEDWDKILINLRD